MTSAVAFVEGGVQDPCDDACSICLENFCEEDPATITTCKHEYHLQCILEWSQRSKECPMCWQPLSLKDPDSQALLAASEQERAVRFRQRASPFYSRSPLDDSEFHRFASSYGDDSDLEDRIMQHLAAAAMGRAQQFARRGDPLRFRPSSGQGHPHFMIVPAHSNTGPNTLANANVSPGGSVSPPPMTVSDLAGLGGHSDHADAGQSEATFGRSASDPVVRGSRNLESSSTEHSLRQRVLLEPVEESHQGPSSSEFQSFSESFKSRLAAASSRYRESLTKTTRGFRERLRNRNGAMADLGARAREVSAGVVRALERISIESADKSRESNSLPNSSAAVDPNVATSLNHSGPSHESESSEGPLCSMSSQGEIVHAGSVTASSSRVTPQPSGVEASHSVENVPGKGIEGSREHGYDLQSNPTGPLPV